MKERDSGCHCDMTKGPAQYCNPRREEGEDGRVVDTICSKEGRERHGPGAPAQMQESNRKKGMILMRCRGKAVCEKNLFQGLKNAGDAGSTVKRVERLRKGKDKNTWKERNLAVMVGSATCQRSPGQPRNVHDQKGGVRLAKIVDSQHRRRIGPAKHQERKKVAAQEITDRPRSLANQTLFPAPRSPFTPTTEKKKIGETRIKATWKNQKGAGRGQLHHKTRLLISAGGTQW